MTVSTLYNSVEGKSLKFNTAEDVKEIVKDIEAINNLREIRLSGNTFGVEAARAIAKAMKKQDALEVIIYLDMNNTIR